MLGLMVQVNRFADWADANLGNSWGIHGHGVEKKGGLRTVNPYTAISIIDNSDVLTSINNPAIPNFEYGSMQLLNAMSSDSAALPKSVSLAENDFFVGFEHGNSVPEYLSLALFRARTSRKFVLKSPGRSDVIY